MFGRTARVKVCHFSLQGDITLPADFTSRYESPWVTPPNREFADPAKRSRMFNDVLDELEYSSRLGFDGVCVNEHHSSLYADHAVPEPVCLRSRPFDGGHGDPRPGQRLAIAGQPRAPRRGDAFIDCLSEGRLVAGLPLGACMDVNHVYGVTPSRAPGRGSGRASTCCCKAWTEPGPFFYNGRFHKLRNVNPDPLPFQQPHPPIWLLGAESKDTWEFAVQHDFAYGFFSFFGYEYGRAGLQDYWETVEEYGKDRNPYRVAFLQMVCVSEPTGTPRPSTRTQCSPSSTSTSPPRRTSSIRPVTSWSGRCSDPTRAPSGCRRRWPPTTRACPGGSAGRTWSTRGS